MKHLTPDQIRRRASQLGDWFHNIDLGGAGAVYPARRKTNGGRA